jgi:hypothetical protein
VLQWRLEVLEALHVVTLGYLVEQVSANENIILKACRAHRYLKINCRLKKKAVGNRERKDGNSFFHSWALILLSEHSNIGLTLIADHSNIRFQGSQSNIIFNIELNLSSDIRYPIFESG